MELIYSIDFASLIKQSQYSGLIVFSIAFLETLLLVGFFFPGSVALVAIGTLISTGHLDLWPTLFWAFAGAVLGDNISFWIGVHFQEPLKKSGLYARHQEAFRKGERFFHQYGAYSVAIGRFIGPIRAVIPAIAGSMGMPGKLFFIVNVLSALLWAPAYIIPGVIFGDVYKLLEKYIQMEFWSLLLISVSILIALFIIKHSRHNKKSIAYIGLLLVSLFSLTFTQTTFPG